MEEEKQEQTKEKTTANKKCQENVWKMKIR